MFGGTPVAKTETLKLLGVSFDAKLSFRNHLHNVAVRESQRLGFVRRAAHVLPRGGRLAMYKGFVRPVLEYAPLVWMGACQTHLDHLDRVQRRALDIIGPGTLLDYLSLRRSVAGLTYLYKLRSTDGPAQLTAMLPPPEPPRPHPKTRRQLDASHHPAYLKLDLSHSAPNYIRRSFPFCLVEVWNSFPAEMLANLQVKKMQTFKVNVHRHLRHKHWLWATDNN
ncbi:uncharacterized protein LOC135816933 [Sycon ciliatum]|uniref:uncharacterized protein LOC135816933 n=1 Tax=Sycon ciliatum TaxID=27933 RepID=UPI0031F60431